MTGFDPLEVGISKLKGLSLGDISTIHKEEGLSWHKSRQGSIQQYSNVPYTPDAMFPYSKILQQDNESTVPCLFRARVLLECIHCMSKLVDISGFGTDNLSLVQGLSEAHIRRWVTKEKESWRTIDVFKSINKVTMTEERMKAYNEPMYDSVSHVAMERVNDMRQGKYHQPRTPSKTYIGSHFRPCNNSHFHSSHATNSHQFSRNQGRPQFSHTQTNLQCYYCEGKHCIRDCDKFTQDKAKFKLKIAEIMPKCKDKIMQKARKDNVSVNEATLLNWPRVSVLSRASQTTIEGYAVK